MRRVRAQALVELALVLPILLTLMAVVFEFGWAYYQVYRLNTGARLVARFGVTQGTFDYGQIRGVALKSTVGVNLSANPMIVVSDSASPFTQRGTYSGVGAAPLAVSAPTGGRLYTVYLRAKYWPFTRMVDLRNFGFPEDYLVSSTFIVP